jgi:UDP-glucose 4-epimerase
MLRAVDAHTADGGVHVYNLGTDETITVNDSLGIILEHVGLSPDIHYSGGSRGWVGDSPLIHLETSRIRSLGWTPTLSIRDAIQRTLQWFDGNEPVWRDHVTSGYSE